MITMLYAAILAVLYAGLSVYVIKGRTKYGVSIGDGGSEGMLKRIRIHGNFAEYAPFGLLLLALVDFARYDSAIVHTLGCLLVAGRICHAIGIARGNYGRQIGMALTFLMILISAGFLMNDFLVFNTDLL